LQRYARAETHADFFGSANDCFANQLFKFGFPSKAPYAQGPDTAPNYDDLAGRPPMTLNSLALASTIKGLRDGAIGLKKHRKHADRFLNLNPHEFWACVALVSCG